MKEVTNMTNTRAKKLTNGKFLNLFEIDAVRKDGTTFPYHVASRAKTEADLLAVSGKRKADAVAIMAMYENKLVLIKQFRYPVGDYIYELPAGLVDEGEDVLTTAKREMFEETGLEFVPDETPWNINPWLSSPGMTDETCAVAFGKCTGTPTNANAEADEDIQVVLAEKDEAIRILNEEIVDVRTAFAIIMAFGLK